jgi:hypothetical protein
MQRILIKKCFLFTVGSVCRVKSFITGWQTFHSWRRGWNGDAEVAETTVKRRLRCGFRCTVKAMGQVYQCRRRICREINVSSRFEYHIFYVSYPFVTYLLSLPRTIPLSSWRWWKPQEIWVKTAGVPTEIRTQHFSNTSQKHYRLGPPVRNYYNRYNYLREIGNA